MTPPYNFVYPQNADRSISTINKWRIIAKCHIHESGIMGYNIQNMQILEDTPCW